MAARGSIPKMMELAGIDMLSPDAGIPLIRRELTTVATRGEVLISQRLGILLNQWDPTGGLRQESETGPASPLADLGHAEVRVEGHAILPIIGKVSGMGLHTGLAIETTLDPKVQPFLHDHQIDGTPVLPGVMGIEAFAEAALWALPGWHVQAIDDVNFLAPFKFYRHEARTVIVHATFHAEGETIVASCRLTGSRSLPNSAEPQVTTHFTGRVRLTKEAPAAAPTATAPSTVIAVAMEAKDIYSVYFHGPAYQVLERAWRNGERIVGLLAKDLPVHHCPPNQSLQVTPRLIELCFQTAGLWEMSVQCRMGLPQHLDQVCLWPVPEPASTDYQPANGNGQDRHATPSALPAESRIYAVVTPDSDGGSFNADVVDTNGNRHLHLHGYRTVALPNNVESEPLKALRTAA